MAKTCLTAEKLSDDMKSETGDVLVVSHDGFIRILLCNILGLPPYMQYKFKTNMGRPYDDRL